MKKMINISDIWDNIDIVSVSSSNTLIQRKKVTSYWLVSTLCRVWLYKYIVVIQIIFSNLNNHDINLQWGEGKWLSRDKQYNAGGSRSRKFLNWAGIVWALVVLRASNRYLVVIRSSIMSTSCVNNVIWAHK